MGIADDIHEIVLYMRNNIIGVHDTHIIVNPRIHKPEIFSSHVGINLLCPLCSSVNLQSIPLCYCDAVGKGPDQYQANAGSGSFH